MEFVKEYNGTDKILDSYVDENGDEYMWVVNEALGQMQFATRNVKGIKGFKDYLTKHPYMTGMAITVGLNALDTYRTNKRLTTRFFATNQIERKLYSKVVADLVKTSQYKLIKDGRRMKGGWMWELKRRSFS